MCLLPFNVHMFHQMGVIRIFRCLGGICFILCATSLVYIPDFLVNWVFIITIIHTIYVFIILVIKIYFIYYLICKINICCNINNVFLVYLILFLRLVFMLFV